MTSSSLIERNSRREMLLEEVERNRQALNNTVAELKTNLRPEHLANEAAQPIMQKTNVAIGSAKNFVNSNPLIALSATMVGVMALTASARSYRKSNQHSFSNGYSPAHRVKRGTMLNSIGRMSSDVLDRVSDTSTNLVHEAANVVKHHIDDRTSSAETAAIGVVRNLTQTAVAAAESMLISTIANTLRAQKTPRSKSNFSDADDQYDPNRSEQNSSSNV
jgi:ElaB/YqjD/DUF883 family membrane-anchored ribosome-binding protein